MVNNFLNDVKNKLIISCQALPDEPLHSSFIMARMARAAKQAGAAAIRANSVVDIQAIQDETGLPMIGIAKVDYPDSPVYITPTMKEMRAIAATGVAVVACQVTGQKRPRDEQLSDIVTQFRQEFPDTLLMADTDTFENAQVADQLGFDMIGTTMRGYTQASEGLNIADDDFAYLKQLLEFTKTPIVVEGRIDTPTKMRRALDLGAHTVVVGSAITRPLVIATEFMKALPK